MSFSLLGVEGSDSLDSKGVLILMPRGFGFGFKCVLLRLVLGIFGIV